VIEVVLFYKDDCDLCDLVLAELQKFIQDHRFEKNICLQLRDIIDHPEWYDQYSEQIPVVLVNNQVVCRYFFDESALCRVLKRQFR